MFIPPSLYSFRVKFIPYPSTCTLSSCDMEGIATQHTWNPTVPFLQSQMLLRVQLHFMTLTQGLSDT